MDDSLSNGSILWTVQVITSSTEDENFKKKSSTKRVIDKTQLNKCPCVHCLSFVCRGLADTKQTGKLTEERFALAMYLIQQKVINGIDPPSTLSPDMIPPSDRVGSPVQTPHLSFSSLFCKPRNYFPLWFEP